MEQTNQETPILSQESAMTVPCPLCAEVIQKDATKCKHCGSFLRPRKDILAIISFISAFLPILCLCVGVAPFVCAIVSLIRIRNYKGILSGKRLAIAAIIIAILTSMLNTLIIVGVITNARNENRRPQRTPFQGDGEMEIGGYWQEAEEFRNQLADIVSQTQAACKSYKKGHSDPKKLYSKIDKLNMRYDELKDDLPGTTEAEFDSANEKLQKMVLDVGNLLEQFDAKRLTQGPGTPDDKQIQAAIESFNHNMDEFFQERDKQR